MHKVRVLAGLRLMTAIAASFGTVRAVELQPAPEDGSVRQWLLCGTFPNPGGRGEEVAWDIDFLEPTGGSSVCQPGPHTAQPVLDVNRQRTGDYALWLPVDSDTPQINLVDLNTNHGGDFAYAVCYLATYVILDQAADVTMRIYSDDGNKTWLNGELTALKRLVSGCVILSP